jgi:hypothetical protein
MFLLTDKARLACLHGGRVRVAASQHWVRIEGHPVQVEGDPVGKSILGCPNVGLMIKPCMVTLHVARGYSNLLQVDGRRVCLDPVQGLTDGTPPGTVRYVVRNPGQHLVSEQ